MTEQMVAGLVHSVRGTHKIQYHPDGPDGKVREGRCSGRPGRARGLHACAPARRPAAPPRPAAALPHAVCQPPPRVGRLLPPPLALLCITPQAVDIDFTPPFRRISMCAGLEEALDCKLPEDLDSEEARLFLVDLVRLIYFVSAVID